MNLIADTNQVLLPDLEVLSLGPHGSGCSIQARIKMGNKYNAKRVVLGIMKRPTRRKKGIEEAARKN